MPSEKTIASKAWKHRGKLVWPSSTLKTYRKSDIDAYLQHYEYVKHQQEIADENNKH